MSAVTPAAGEAAFNPFSGLALAGRTALTEPQREIWLATQMHPEAALAFNDLPAIQQPKMELEALDPSFDL